jgi:competence protein ComEC
MVMVTMAAAPDTTTPSGAEQKVYCRHRPLIPVLAGVAMGIWLDESLRPAFVAWAVLGCATLALGVCAVLIRGRPWLHWTLAAVVVVPVAGAYHFVRVRDVAPYHLIRLLKEGSHLCRVRGIVKQEPELRNQTEELADPAEPPRQFWVVRLDVQAVSSDGTDWRKVSGGVTVFARSAQPQLNVGDIVEFLCELKRYRGPTNPGQRDMREVYGRMGSVATAAVYSPDAFHVTKRSRWWSSVPAAVGRLRARIRHALLERGGHPLAICLILGDRGLLDPQTFDAMCESGSVHFIAISGLHVGLFAAFFWAVLVSLRLRVQWRSAVLIALIWAYVLLTGAQVPAQRAGWMLTLVIGAPLLQRRSDSVSALLAAALLILSWSPSALFSPGFQLTFTAVWAIMYLYRNTAMLLWPHDAIAVRLLEESERTLRWELSYYTRHYLLLSVAVWLAVTPLTAHYYHHFSLVAPLVNLFLWPLMLLLIVASFVLVPLALLGGAFAGLLVGATSLLGAQCEALVNEVASLDALIVHTAGMPAWWMALYYAAIGIWALRMMAQAAAARIFVVVVGVLSAGYVWTYVAAQKRADAVMTVVDVGHGQAVALRMPSGATMVIDAGSAAMRRAEPLEGVLWSWRVTRLRARWSCRIAILTIVGSRPSYRAPSRLTVCSFRRSR